LKLAVIQIDGVYLKAIIKGERKNMIITFVSVVLVESTRLYFFLWRMKTFFLKYLFKIKSAPVESIPSLAPEKTLLGFNLGLSTHSNLGVSANLQSNHAGESCDRGTCC